MVKNGKLETTVEEQSNKSEEHRKKSFFSLNTRKFVANNSRLPNLFQRKKSSTHVEKMHAELKLMSAMQASTENADSVALSSNAESEPSYGFVSRFVEESSQLMQNVPGITSPTPVVVNVDPSFLKYHNFAWIHGQGMEVEQNEPNKADITAMDLRDDQFSSETMMQDNQSAANADDATNTPVFEDAIRDDLYAADHFMKDPPSSNYNFDATAQLAQIESSSKATSNLHLQAEGAEMAQSLATALVPASSCHPLPDSNINPIMDDLRAAVKIVNEIKDATHAAAKALSVTPFAPYPPICPISTVNNIYLINSSTSIVANTSNNNNISNISINPVFNTIPRICAADSNMSPDINEMIVPATKIKSLSQSKRMEHTETNHLHLLPSCEEKHEETKKRVFDDATEYLAQNQTAIVALPMRARCHQTEEGCTKFMRISNKSEDMTSDN
jgi:hypothetical protein